MYSGFVTTKRVVKKIGVHQKFDTTAYRMISSYLEPQKFPDIAGILHFEGYNGPDGLNVKSPGVDNPDHLYDPATDKGEVPVHIANHYRDLTESLRKNDMVRAAFDASWLAHYVGDGLTPAHHFPLDYKIGEAIRDYRAARSASKRKLFLHLEDPVRIIRDNWSIWGSKGVMSTHFNFEMGVAVTMLFSKARVKLDMAKLAEARRLGPVEFFKQEARDVASLHLYDRFYAEGWNADIAKIMMKKVVPQASSTIGIIWLLAYLEASQKDLASLRKD